MFDEKTHSTLSILDSFWITGRYFSHVDMLDVYPIKI